MSGLAILGGICSALTSGLQILSAFRTESASSVVDQGHGTGFWDFYSYSTVGTIMLRAATANEYVAKRLIPRVMKCDSEEMQKHKDDIVSELQDIADYAELSIGQTDRAFTTTSYSKNSGKLWFYVYTFSAESQGDVHAVKCSTMLIEVELKMAQDWMLVNRMETSFFKAKNTFEIQYLPKAIDPKEVENAIAIALAPAVVGLVEVPEKFLQIMGGVINSTEPSDLPKYTSETLEQIMAEWEKMVARRQQQDQTMLDAIAKFNQSAATLFPETGKNQTNEWMGYW